MTTHITLVDAATGLLSHAGGRRRVTDVHSRPCEAGGRRGGDDAHWHYGHPRARSCLPWVWHDVSEFSTVGVYDTLLWSAGAEASEQT